MTRPAAGLLPVLALLCACASVEAPPEPPPEPTVAELVDRARAVPLTKEASPASRAAWEAVLERAGGAQGSGGETA